MPDVKPGSKAFGVRAAQRRERLSPRKADLRVQTAHKTVKAATARKNRYLKGD